MSHAEPTADEVIATLQRSNLPTVLVEGTNDADIYHWIEQRLAPIQASVLPCGGRATLLRIFERRAEFQDTRVVFIADRDMWLFTQVPQQYEEIIWTTGYSIENDLYAGSKIERLLEGSEKKIHREILKCAVQWFAFEIEEYRFGRSCQVACHINEVVSPPKIELSQNFIKNRGYRRAKTATIREVRKNYKLHLRGKTLFQILVRILNAPRRPAKYSLRAVLEVAFKSTQRNRHIERITQEIQKRF